MKRGSRARISRRAITVSTTAASWSSSERKMSRDIVLMGVEGVVTLRAQGERCVDLKQSSHYRVIDCSLHPALLAPFDIGQQSIQEFVVDHQERNSHSLHL